MKNLIAKKHLADVKTKIAELILKDRRTSYELMRYSQNSILSYDDVSGEFNVGLADGINKVRADIGNPKDYLINKGLWQVRHAIRKELKRKVIQRCACGHSVSIQHRGICPKCGNKAETQNRTQELLDVHGQDDHEIIDVHIQLRMFVHQLNGRKREICEMMLNGVDGDSYLKAIATKLKCSPVAVAIHVKKLRALWEKNQK